MKRNLCWYLRQLFPLRYVSYFHVKSGDLIRSTWRMWFGRVYDTQTVKVDECTDYIGRWADSPKRR